MSDWRDWPEVQGAVVLDGFDDAVVGVSIGSPGKLIYSTTKIEEILCARDAMDEDGAAEFAWRTIYTAYFGDRSPLFSTLVNEVY